MKVGNGFLQSRKPRDKCRQQCIYMREQYMINSVFSENEMEKMD